MRAAEQQPVEASPTGPADAGESAIWSQRPAMPAVQKRPPSRALRFVTAYWVTFVVILSYLSVRFWARFRSAEGTAQALRRAHLKNARRIERAILKLQGLFIKIGQLISIMTNFLPKEFREQLAGLQDQVPPRPYKDIDARFREEFNGKTPAELFQTFDETPIASASIGQVHQARLPNGRKVAVKFQYPNIERLVQSDLRTLKRILRIVSWFVPYEGLDQVYREVSVMIREELDFRAEANNVERIAQNFRDRPDVRFPRVVHELSTARVLTTHWESGVKIGNFERLDELGVNRQELAKLVIEAYCQQIFTDGIYHADPHPGNILVRRGEDGELSVVFIDFGAVATVSPQMRQGIVSFLQAAMARDTQRVVKAMKMMGFIARGANDQVFDRVVEHFYSRFQEQVSVDSFNLRDIRFDPEKRLEDLADLRRMDVSLRELSASFHMPREWIVLHRTILLLMGLCTALDPDMNPMTVIRPYLERFVLGPEGDWSNFLVDTSKDALMSLAALPADIRKFVASARGGEISLRFHNFERSSVLIYRLGHQVIFAALGITCVAVAMVLEGRAEAARAEWAWWGAKGAFALLIWSWWSTRRIMKRIRRHQ